MSQRTSLVLDEKCRRAARQLAARMGCTVSEAIRRAILRQRDVELGPSREEIRRRVRLLEVIFELHECEDPAAEVARLKAEDRYF
jgi:hypothetical protein